MVSTAAAISAGSSPRRCARSSAPRSARAGAGSVSPACSSACDRSRRRSCELLEDAEEDLTGLLRVPARALDQAALDEPAGARQPRDRPALRCRRDLPQRRRGDPSRRRAADRSKTTSGSCTALPVRRVDGARPRPTDRTGRRRRAGGRAPCRLNTPCPNGALARGSSLRLAPRGWSRGQRVSVQP